MRKFFECIGDVAKKNNNQYFVCYDPRLGCLFKCCENYFIIIPPFLGTSTRKPRLNSALVAQQAATQIQFPGSSNPHSSKSSNRVSKNKNKRSKYVRLKNIDRSTGQTREVTVNSVTVFITEYKAKIVNSNRESRHGDSSDFSESNDSRS